MQNVLAKIVEAVWFQRFIITVIILNAISLGLETVPEVNNQYGETLVFLDVLFLGIYTIELAMKLILYRLRFFKDGWNNFDFLIVAVSYLPLVEGLSVLRSLRILRVLRLMSVVPQFRKVTQAFFDSLSGLSVITFILLLLFYIGAVMSTKMFGTAFPEWFGSIGRSLFSLFQIMTLESWSSAIARPVMELYPHAWLFFVPFILTTTFVTLNLLIGVIVNSMQGLHEDTTENIDKHLNQQDKERENLKNKLSELENSIQDIKKNL